jgi:hypothetical protein
MGGRRRAGHAGDWKSPSKPVGRPGRQIHLVIPERRWGAKIVVAKWPDPCCQEKPLASQRVPVPQTATGRQGEYPKARGRTLVKELGKMAP